MKARIEKVSIYVNEDVMLVAPAKEMENFACYMANMIEEAIRKAYEDGRTGTAKHYSKIAHQFSNIFENIIEEEKNE